MKFQRIELSKYRSVIDTESRETTTKKRMRVYIFFSVGPYSGKTTLSRGLCKILERICRVTYIGSDDSKNRQDFHEKIKKAVSQHSSDGVVVIEKNCPDANSVTRIENLFLNVNSAVEIIWFMVGCFDSNNNIDIKAHMSMAEERIPVRGNANNKLPIDIANNVVHKFLNNYYKPYDKKDAFKISATLSKEEQLKLVLFNAHIIADDNEIKNSIALTENEEKKLRDQSVPGPINIPLSQAIQDYSNFESKGKFTASFRLMFVIDIDGKDIHVQTDNLNEYHVEQKVKHIGYFTSDRRFHITLKLCRGTETIESVKHKYSNLPDSVIAESTTEYAYKHHNLTYTRVAFISDDEFLNKLNMCEINVTLNKKRGILAYEDGGRLLLLYDETIQPLSSVFL
jgi:hypothetical protein